MKKFMTLAAFAALVLSAQAATITWGVGGDLYLMKAGESYTSAVLANDTSAPEVAAGSYLALVYVGQSVSTFDVGTITASAVVESSPYAIESGEGWASYDPWSIDTATTAYNNGAAFGIVWFDAGRNKFDYLYSMDDGSALNQTVVVDDMSVTGMGAISATDGAPQTYSAALAVPEPSTAMLALAGLALLIKRRRA